MILTYAVYIIIFLLIIWGCKFAGFSGYNDDSLDESTAKSIRGLAALLIIFHHISQRPAFQDVTRELYFFNNIGFLFVTVFFFSSGYGLTVSAKNKPDYLKSFITRRLPKILIPFFVTNIIFAIYYLTMGNMALPQALLGIFGIVNVNPNAWYPIVIVIMYLVFYLGQKYLKKDSTRLLAYLLTTILLIVVFCINGHFAWWAGKPGWWIYSGFENVPWWMQQQVFWFSGEWWVNSTIGFTVGAVFAMYKEKIIAFFKKGYWLKLLICIVLFVVSYKIFFDTNNRVGGYWTEFGSNRPEIKTKLMLSGLQFPVSLFFTVLIQVILMKFETRNPVTHFLGKISYETYLIGVIVLDAFNFLIINDHFVPIVKQPYHYNLAIYTICVVLVTILLGYLLNRFNNYLLSLKKKRRS